MTSVRVGSKPKQGLMNELNQLQVFSAGVIVIFYVELNRKTDCFCPPFTLFCMPAGESSRTGHVSPQILVLCFVANHCHRAPVTSASFSSALQASVLQIINYLFRVHLRCMCSVPCKYVFWLIKSLKQISSHIVQACFSVNPTTLFIFPTFFYIS